jgi:hypothetical protein
MGNYLSIRAIRIRPKFLPSLISQSPHSFPEKFSPNRRDVSRGGRKAELLTNITSLGAHCGHFA